jgi:hypothetical protein
MIIAETILAISVLCTVPKRKVSEFDICYVSDGVHAYQLSSGVSLERKVTIDLSEIDGVRDVDISRNGNVFEVRVAMNTLEFEKFEKVVQKEIELFDAFPGLTFNFDISLADRAELAESVLYAA